MASFPMLLLSATIKLHHWIREVAYEDMARQALGWVPDDALIEKSQRLSQPLQLDFDVAKKHRLGWARRRADHLPY